ncbi:MAG: CDP-glucose 4,6-dehydratase [Candidatus Omnitrophica bacterium]|nr:CDP-glucose 4,6-dehydratase [Candidatus Omnitrophota bacterium]
MNVLRQVFKGKKVLVTGDTGFKGSWLCLWLHELGAEVLGFALPPVNSDDHFNLLGLRSMIRHVDGDIRDLAQVRRAVDDFKPEILFHLAAQAIVRVSYQDPKTTFDTNVGGTVNVLEAVRHCGSLKAIVDITSDKCYFNNEWLWGYRESDTLGGHDPYSASKAAAELVVAAYRDSFFQARRNIGVASARAGNVIGGGDWAKDRIIPDCIRSLKGQAPIVIRNPQSTRPWQHVLEPLSGYLTLAVRLLEDPVKFAGAYNFGPAAGSIRTVKDVVDGVVAAWGSGSINVCPEPNAPHEAGLLHLNCDKAYQVLGWSSRWDADQTIRETVAWYKEMLNGRAVLSLSREQINRYMGA